MRPFSGTRTDTIEKRRSEFNIDVCQNYNFASWWQQCGDGVELHTFFKKNYVTLLNSISEDNHCIIVSGLLPRISVDLKPYSDRLIEILVENDTEFIDNYDCFLLASGEMPDHSFIIIS